MAHQSPAAPKTANPWEIRLYRELLACLEHEEQALKAAREPEILAAAREQEAILAQLAALPPQEGPREDAAALADLKRRVGAQLARNRAIITAALEVIQDFLDLLAPPGPGLYQQAGRLQAGPGNCILHRQV